MSSIEDMVRPTALGFRLEFGVGLVWWLGLELRVGVGFRVCVRVSVRVDLDL